MNLSETVGNKEMQRLAKTGVFQKKSILNKTRLPDKLKTGVSMRQSTSNYNGKHHDSLPMQMMFPNRLPDEFSG